MAKLETKELLREAVECEVAAAAPAGRRACLDSGQVECSCKEGWWSDTAGHKQQG